MAETLPRTLFPYNGIYEYTSPWMCRGPGAREPGWPDEGPGECGRGPTEEPRRCDARVDRGRPAVVPAKLRVVSREKWPGWTGQRSDSCRAQSAGRCLDSRIERRRDLHEHQERCRSGLQHGALQGQAEGRGHLEPRQLHSIDQEVVQAFHSFRTRAHKQCRMAAAHALNA